MADGWLLKGIQDLVDKTKLLETENGNITVRVRELEREKREAGAMIEALERAEKQAAIAIEAFERAERTAAVKIDELEHEKRQAALTIQGLEREVGQLAATIAQASAMVSEALKEGTAADISQPNAVNMPTQPEGLEQTGESSADSQRELTERLPRVFDPTEYSAR
jgi:chromosome segregation ATPase